MISDEVLIMSKMINWCVDANENINYFGVYEYEEAQELEDDKMKDREQPLMKTGDLIEFLQFTALSTCFSEYTSLISVVSISLHSSRVTSYLVFSSLFKYAAFARQIRY